MAVRKRMEPHIHGTWNEIFVKYNPYSMPRLTYFNLQQPHLVFMEWIIAFYYI